MKKKLFKRRLAIFLVALMLVQGIPLSLAKNDQGRAGSYIVKADNQPVLKKDGEAIIPSNTSEEDIKNILFNALVSNKDGINAQDLKWEYYCKGKNGLLTNEAWGSIFGFTSKKTLIYTHPSLANNDDGNYQVRLAGTTEKAALTKAAKLQSSISVIENSTVGIVYQESGKIDGDKTREAIYNTVIASTTPELELKDLEIKYYATATTGNVGSLGKNWAPLEGGEVSGLNYPSISAGDQKIRISWDGNDQYSSFSKEINVTFTERSVAPHTLNDPINAVNLTVDGDMNVKYDDLYSAIFNAIIAESNVLSPDNVTIEYLAPLTTGSLTEKDKDWMPLEGGSKTVLAVTLNYNAISEGSHKIRISWPGNSEYLPVTIEKTIIVNDRPVIDFVLNDGPYNIGMAFNSEQGYDYNATARNIFNTIVKSTNPEVDFEDITITWNSDLTGVTQIDLNYKPLDWIDPTGLIKFDIGTREIRISWNGNQEYKGGFVKVKVNVEDGRIASNVVLKEGESFVYNMDPSVMEGYIYNNIIDWENSNLPNKETLTVDDFIIEYYAEGQLPGGINSGIRNWVPIAGKTVDLGNLNLSNYPQMGAAESQKIRVSYKGNGEFRPSSKVETTVKVEKANVKVSVNSTNIFAGDKIPTGFITTNPADKFDIYTIYAGATSNITTALYLQLPERYTDNAFIKILDPIVKGISGKTFTEMMNNGVTLAELRTLLNTQGLLEALDKLNIDTGTFGQILSAIDKLPAIADSVRVSFGTPDHSGLYTVVAVTDSPNYNTGVGIGFLLLKMRSTDVKLTWNQQLSNKITVAEAKNFDFKATLSYEGDSTIDQSNIKYLYSGLTSKVKVYSSTTTPPTEPGRYSMTVVTFGGNYLAAPITRTFQITK